MRILPSFTLLLVLSSLGVSSAFADAQMCNEMYPQESYDAEERNALIQDCMAAYAPEPDKAYEESAASEPAYYEGTVEDFVQEAPVEQTPAE